MDEMNPSFVRDTYPYICSICECERNGGYYTLLKDGNRVPLQICNSCYSDAWGLLFDMLREKRKKGKGADEKRRIAMERYGG